MGHSFARTDVDEHDLLSAEHADTTPAAPVAGDLISAQQTITGLVDDSKFWLDGAPLNAIAGANTPAGVKYWLDGFPMEAIIAGSVTSAATWRRRAAGNEGDVLRMRSGAPTWEAISALSIGQGARVYRSAASFTLTWGVPTAMTFDVAENDDAGYFSTGTPTRFTVPTAGWYLVSGQVAADYAQFGLLQCQLRVNGTIRASAQLGLDNVSSGWGVTYDTKQVSSLLYLTAGQYVEFYVTASRASGANATMIGGAGNAHFSIMKVG